MFLRRIVLTLLAVLLALPLFALDPPRERDFTSELDALHAVLDYHEQTHRLDGRVYGLPANDFDDVTNLTLRQRREFRELYPETRTEGIYQYPRWAYDFMNRLDARGGLVLDGKVVEASELPAMLDVGGIPVPTALVVGTNVDVSNNSQVESETYLAIDPTDSRYLLGASNNITNDPQMTFRSSDWGATWTTTLLPLVCTYHSDPWTGFDSYGVAYSSTLEYSTGCKGKTNINYFRSTDHGATWTSAFTINANSSNDKQLNVIDNQPTSPCRDHHYIGWDTGSENVAAAPAWNGPWTVKSSIDSSSIGTDLAVGPDGEIYDVWAKTTGQIRFAKSTDCGATWSSAATVSATVDGYDYGIPAQCARRVLIYPSVDVDRTSGPHRGWVYVAWNDFTAAQGSGCVSATSTNTANVWFSRSTDGGASWSTKKTVHETDTALPRTDQFNQWMRVDDADGSIHVSWYDTRNDPARVKTEIYYTRSFDGGTTFETPTKISSATSDESSGNGNQYGDYAGLAVEDGVAYPFWTDSRTAWGGDEEIATARICSDAKDGGTTIAVGGCSSITISWPLPTVFWGDAGAGTRSFQLYRDGLLVQSAISSATTSTSDTPGDTSTHVYTIHAVNGCGNDTTYASSATVAVGGSGGPPPAVTGVTGTKTATDADFSWPASASPDVTGYKVYWSADPSATFPGGWTFLGSTATTSYNDPLATAHPYYRVTSVDACGGESS